jgi:hypothetical protein
LSVPRDFHIFYKNLDHNCTWSEFYFL